MKIFSIILLLFVLVSCWGESKEIEQAKQNLLNTVSESWENVAENIPSPQSENVVPSENLESYTRVENVFWEGFIEVAPVWNVENILETLDISWNVLSKDITKITVSFENPTSAFPKDENYVLQTYKPGNSTFLYRAYKKYSVLDKGQNLYKIDAYIWEELKQTVVLEVFLANETQKEILNVWAQIEMSSQTGNLEIFELTSSGITCENVWDFLSNRYSWYYWNTCRPVVKDQSFAVHVLRLDGENYLYEKHYFDTIKNMYAVATLETGSGITREQLPEQNAIFREKIFTELAGFDNEFINYNKN